MNVLAMQTFEQSQYHVV